MEKTTKIFLGVLVPLAIASGYVFIFKNREPILDLEETDWINDVAKIKHNIIRDKLWALIKEVQFGDQVRTEVDFADGGFGVRPDVLVTFFNAKIICQNKFNI
jgi:hypothetical protein